MESKHTEQIIFKGIVTDVNEINVAIAKGAMADNFNGRISPVGGNRYAWTSEKGTIKYFSIPNVTGETFPIQRSKARVYMFDDRVFDALNTNSLKQATSGAATYSYEYILEFSAYNEAFTSIDLSAPVFQIRVEQRLSRSSGVVTFGTVYFSYRTGTSGVWNSSTGYSFYNPGTIADPLGTLHTSLATYYNAYVNSVGGGIGVYDSVATKVYDPILDSVYVEVELAHNTNLVVKNLKGETTPTAYYFTENKFGFGHGSRGESLGYPNAPKYAIPGSDYPLNPFSDYVPCGITQEYIEGKTYYVVSGCVQILSGGAETFYYKGDKFTVNSNGESTPAQNNFIKNIVINREKTKTIEVNPIGFGYGITVQKYRAAYTTKTVSPKFVGSISIDKNKALLFFSIANSGTIIYKLDVVTTPFVTELIYTTENIDINNNSEVFGFCKYDDDTNIRAYWTSGFGHIRTINLNKIPTESFDFNTRLIKPCNFGNIDILNVSRTGGGLLCGSYQFCFELSIDGFVWTRSSQRTNIIMIGQSYWGAEGLVGGETKTATYPKANPEIEPSYRGAIPGTKTTESINVLLTNLDTRYNYIRVFSIESISGSSSKVVNKIYQERLQGKDFYSLSIVHQGANSVIEGNLNISEISSRQKVPLNVKWISQINNRIIIGNFTENYKLRSDLESEVNPVILSKPAKQGIGCDTTDLASAGPNGHKYWENQYRYKTFPSILNDTYAWAYIDEYGNESEPSQPFNLEYDFRRFQNALYYNLMPHPHGISSWAKNYTAVSGGGGSQEALFVTPEWLYDSAFLVKGGFFLYSYGLYIKLQNFAWPSWAKKAILVQKKKTKNKQYIITEGYGILTSTGIKVSYLPELEGYNVYDNYVYKQGDKIRITGTSYVEQTSNANWNDPAVYIFATKPEYYTGAGDQDFLFDILSFSQEVYPRKYEDGFAAWESKMPAETINSRGYVFALNLGSKYATIKAKATNPSGYLTGNPLVRFQIERPENLEYQPEDTETFINTGFSIDLKERFENLYRRVFFGDSYISTNHQILAMRAGFYNFDVNYLNSAGGSTFPLESGYTPVVVMPLISKFNMAMADDSAFPFYRMNAVVHNYNAHGFRNVNRDYGAINDTILFSYISEQILAKRQSFKNVFIHSDVVPIGSIYDGYSLLKATNQIEVQSDFGEITSIWEIKGKLIVVQQNGTRSFVLDSKEFVQTTSGSIITASAGQFVDTNHFDLSVTTGSDYRGVKTEKGIYIISSNNNMLCLIDSENIVPISLELGFQSLFNEHKPKKDNRNIKEFNGVSLFYNPNEKLVYVMIKAREILGHLISSLAGSVSIFKGDIKPVVGSYYGVFETISGIAHTRYFKIDSVVVGPNSFQLLYTKSYLVPGFKSMHDIWLTTVNEGLFAAYNETEEALEFRGSNRTLNFLPNQITIDLMNANQLNIPEKVSSVFSLVNETAPKINLGGNTWNQIWNVCAGLNLVENTTVAHYTTDFILSLSGAMPTSKYLLGSKNEFHFVKGMTYEITYEISFPSGGDLPSKMKYLLGPAYELLEDCATPINPGRFLDALYSNTSANEITYSFKVNKSFVSQIALYCLNPNLSANGLSQRIKLKSLNYFETIESNLELYVSSESSEMISYDNLILTGKELVFPDRIEIYSKEQEAYLNISNVSTYAKMRLRQMQMAIPKLSTKERLRSTYFKIKFVYVSTGAQKIINGIKSFYRTI